MCYLHAHPDACIAASAFLIADAQKLAKQAIYSLHRGDYDRAEQQLASVGGCVSMLASVAAAAAGALQWRPSFPSRTKAMVDLRLAGDAMHAMMQSNCW
jgi:hypothetical protein